MIIIILLQRRTEKEHRVRLKKEDRERYREIEAVCNRAYVMNVLTNYLKILLEEFILHIFRFVLFQRGMYI